MYYMKYVTVEGTAVDITEGTDKGKVHCDVPFPSVCQRTALIHTG